MPATKSPSFWVLVAHTAELTLIRVSHSRPRQLLFTRVSPELN